LATGSSSSPELAAALHRLRSTLARMKAELELTESDGEQALAERIRGDLSLALDLVATVETSVFGVPRVLVVDDDERLGELTARGLRRLGYDAESSASMRRPRPGEVVILDLSVSASLRPDEREILQAARPIVVTGAADPASRASADELGASDYLVKPVDLAALSAAIQRRVELKS
jgi:CheY-like chemotaxis protein